MKKLLFVALVILPSSFCFSQELGQFEIHLKEFTIHFPGFSVRGNEKIAGTNAEVGAEFGLLDTLFITTATLQNIELEERYETSIGISDEGPHCDLINWKHYTSEWRRLKQEGSFLFRAIQYTKDETSRFPKITMNELIDAVAKHCDKRWVDHAKKAKSPNDYPCSVSISKYFIKVKAIRKATGEKFESVITIVMPMGC
jgi:hypothetical protein